MTQYDKGYNKALNDVLNLIANSHGYCYSSTTSIPDTLAKEVKKLIRLDK